MSAVSVSCALVVTCFGFLTGSTLAWAEVSARANEQIVEPVFREGSHWVFNIRSKAQSRESSFNIQWTLLYPAVNERWVFARQKPDNEAPPNTIMSIAGTTDTAWTGRDSRGPMRIRVSGTVFPLYVGKSWATEFDSADGSLIRCTHRAVTWEDVIVPAGPFRTLKIEDECRKSNQRVGSNEVASTENEQIFDAQPTVRAVRWYSPVAQNFVREVMYLQSPVVAENHFELINFKLAPLVSHADAQGRNPQ